MGGDFIRQNYVFIVSREQIDSFFRIRSNLCTEILIYRECESLRSQTCTLIGETDASYGPLQGTTLNFNALGEVAEQRTARNWGLLHRLFGWAINGPFKA